MHPSQILLGFSSLCFVQGLSMMQSPMGPMGGSGMDGQSTLAVTPHPTFFQRLAAHRVLPRFYGRNSKHGTSDSNDGR